MKANKTFKPKSANLLKPSRWSITMLKRHNNDTLRGLASAFGIKNARGYDKETLAHKLIEHYRQGL